jgi:hypothetical protein
VLQELGYPAAVTPALESFAARVERGVPAESRATAARALRRLANVCPPLASRLREAAHALSASVRADEPIDTYVPRPLSAELSEILDAPPALADRGHAVVHRILRDL